MISIVKYSSIPTVFEKTNWNMKDDVHNWKIVFRILQGDVYLS